MEPIIATILLLGLTLGILYKTYLPYKDKVVKGKIETFDPKFLWTAISAFIGALVTALGMFEDVALAWTNGWPFGTGYIAVFGFGFLWAVAWNYGANNITKLPAQLRAAPPGNAINPPEWQPGDGKPPAPPGKPEHTGKPN